MKHSIKSLILVLLLAGIVSAQQQQQWGLVPEEQPFVEEGKFTAVEGATEPTGVRFVLDDLSLNQPVVLTVTASNPDKPVRIEMATENWDKPHRNGQTGEDGEYSTVFRADGLAGITVKGEQGAKFQLAVWVGPEKKFELPSTLVSMTEFENADVAPQQADDKQSATTEVAQSQTKELSSPTPDGIPSWALASLGFSGLCLVGMVAMFIQVKNLKSGANLIVFGLLFTLIGAQSPARADSPAPGKVNPTEARKSYQKLRDTLKQLGGSSSFDSEFNSATGAASNDPIMRQPDSKTTGELTGNLNRQRNLDRRNRTRRNSNRARNIRNGVRSTAQRGATMLDMAMAVADFLDPKVAPLADDQVPGDLPPLPTRSLDDNNYRGLDEFQAAEARLMDTVKRFEKLKHIYMVTMAKEKAFNDFSNAAGSTSPLVGIAVMQAKSDPNLSASKAKFLNIYDDAFNKLMTAANESLLEMAACERKHFGQDDWYDRYGLPYYTYLNNRYLRR